MDMCFVVSHCSFLSLSVFVVAIVTLTKVCKSLSDKF